ncbi:MAG: putative toxin-antitoxin system toxin component, PIN family [bacterium]
MKILIDTNVLISAILKDKKPEEIIVFVASHDDIEWIVSKSIIQEYKDVLRRRKFKLPADILKKWFLLFDKLTTLVDVNVVINFPRDQKDSKFLECALTSHADYFITGDNDFASLEKFGDTKLISVSLFTKRKNYKSEKKDWGQVSIFDKTGSLSLTTRIM